MKKEQLSDAIGNLDEAILQETLTARAVPRRRHWRSWVAVAACLCVLVGCLLTLPLWQEEGYGVSAPTANSTTATTTTTATTSPNSGTPLKDVDILGLAKYPTMAQRPTGEEFYAGEAHDTWRKELADRRQDAEAHADGMTAFYTKTMQTFLSGKAGENRVYSPLNLYFALSMLAETAEGNSRTQILNLLGVSDLIALRQKNHALWNGVYMNDGAVTCRFANSLWLAEGERWQYDTASAQNLAYNYYASVYKGVMGSESYDRALRGWLNDQTDGLLQEQSEGLRFDPDTAMALASAVCFRAKWTEWFDAEKTTVGTFHAATGDVPCKMMNRNPCGFAYFGDDFTAVRLDLDDGAYGMTFFLPDTGVSAEQLAGDPQMMEVLCNADRSAIGKYVQIDMRIPKFDVSSDVDLAEGLRELGVTDVFHAEEADFGGILTADNEPVYLNQVNHAARVAIDEEGVTAAAYTVMMLCGTGAPMEKLDFTLDRPFMFAVTGPADTILFSCIVENPQ